MQKNVMSARGRTILYAVLILFAVIQVYPIIWVILQSIKTTEELTNLSALSLPSSLYTGHFKKALEVSTIPRSFLNSTIVAVVTLTLEVAICCPFAFAVRKLRWKGGEKVFNFVLLGMMIPVFCCLIPMFKVFNTLDLRNTYLALILPQVGFSIPIVTYMYRSFMDYVPDSVLESAYIDGATTFQTFMRIVVPMVRNTTVTVLTYRFIYVWNEFTYANTFLTDRAMRTLPITLKDFTGEFGLVEWGPTFAAIVMAVTPTLILYFILSKNVIEGLALGAVKS